MIKIILFFGVLVEALLITACSSSADKQTVNHEKRCAKGVFESCNLLAEQYEKSGNNDFANKVYERTCNLGSMIGCNHFIRLNNSKGSANNKCNFGNTCFELGKLYYKNNDYQKARDFYEKSCHFDYGDGCFSLGYLYHLGYGVIRDDVTANKYYRKACSYNSAGACNNLGNQYANGKGEQKNYQEALNLYKKACDLGNENGCTNYKNMAENFQKNGCNSGIDCFNLAYDYYQNNDYQKARDFYEKSCRFDYGAGCCNLGYLYSNGLGVEKSDFSANIYYRKACSLNNAIACYNLGNNYASEKGEQKNYQEALNLYKKACDLGNEYGCANYKIRTAYLKGENENTQNKDCQNGVECLTKGSRYGNEGDFSRAGVYYGYACDFGNGSGCNKLGLLYEEGVGDIPRILRKLRNISGKPVITVRQTAAIIWPVFLKKAGEVFRTISGQRCFTKDPAV